MIGAAAAGSTLGSGMGGATVSDGAAASDAVVAAEAVGRSGRRVTKRLSPKEGRCPPRKAASPRAGRRHRRPPGFRRALVSASRAACPRHPAVRSRSRREPGVRALRAVAGNRDRREDFPRRSACRASSGEGRYRAAAARAAGRKSGDGGRRASEDRPRPDVPAVGGGAERKRAGRQPCDRSPASAGHSRGDRRRSLERWFARAARRSASRSPRPARVRAPQGRSPKRRMAPRHP